MDIDLDHEMPEVEISVAVLMDREKCWIQQRRGPGHLAGFWEFPGGKVEEGETSLQALIREVREESGLALEHNLPRLFLVHSHFYGCFRVKLHFYLCRLEVSFPLEGGRWVSVEDLDEYTFPPANIGVLQRLKSLPRRRPKKP